MAVTIRSLFGLLLAYIAAAPLTEKISLDLTKTEWTNILTYVIWLFSFAIWAAIIVFVMAVVAVILER